MERGFVQSVDDDDETFSVMRPVFESLSDESVELILHRCEHGFVRHLGQNIAKFGRSFGNLIGNVRPNMIRLILGFPGEEERSNMVPLS